MRLQQTLKQHHYIVTTSKNTSNESGKQSKKVGNVMVSNHLEHQTVGIDSAGSCSRGGGVVLCFGGRGFVLVGMALLVVWLLLSVRHY
jgi:hypothetical protein